ncbi:hypothetical protein FRB99_007711 [Tulasnella sp. 403]|nr:hypothetical protein FRB99_007711 [Tulasnella sp. 403]
MDTDGWSTLKEHIVAMGGFVGPVAYHNVPGAGRGLLLTQDVQSSTVLVEIPAQALVNLTSIASFFPKGLSVPGNQTFLQNDSSLNSTQALSFYLYLWRKGRGDTAQRPYLATLPANFDEHPLSWSISGGDSEQRLLDALTPSARELVKLMEDRFQEDWTAIRTSVARTVVEGRPFDQLEGCPGDFVWAWLCVNTRCIHYSLDGSNTKRSLKDIDLTLCPIIDFANHTIIHRRAAQVTRKANGSLVLRSPPQEMKKGEEILLHYNSNSNATLFAEYGFVIPRPTVEDDDMIPGADINVDDIVESLFTDQEGMCKKGIIESRGYWGDPDAHWGTGSPLDAWQATLLGTRDTVDQENEAAMRQSLRGICQEILTRSQSGLENHKILREALASEAEIRTCIKYALACLEVLWQEEHSIALGVIQSIDLGVDF